MLQQMVHRVHINKTDILTTNVVLNFAQSAIVNACLCRDDI